MAPQLKQKNGLVWEDEVQKYITLGEEIADRQWIQAGIVSGIKQAWGGEMVREFGKTVRRSYNYLMKTAATWERFRGPNKDVNESKVLSFSHHVAIHNTANPEEWLAMAEDENIDSRTLEELARRNDDLDTTAIQGSYFDNDHWRTCPECRGRGKVPVDEGGEEDSAAGVQPAPLPTPAAISAGGGMKRVPTPNSLKIVP